MTVSFDVRGKTVLVTGANRGIGRAIVESCVQHGVAKVYAAVRKLDSAAPLVAAYGDKVVPVRTDLAEPVTVIAAAEMADDVELVVNSAGVLRNATPLSEDAIEVLEYEMETNVRGLIRMAQAFAPVLRANGGGAFVQLNSVASITCFTDFALYSASKAAAYSITQALRELLGQQGTQVLSIHPGAVASDMANTAGLQEIAVPPSMVGDAMIAALQAGDFHLFPDPSARPYGRAYQSFAEKIVEA